jgi:carboxypeptidase family protein
MERDSHRARSLALAVAVALLAMDRVQASAAEAADRLAGPPPGGVTGRVMDSSGEPLRGVRITLRRGATVQSVETDPDGVYCFCRVVPARDYTLLAESDGFARVMQRDLSVGRRKLSVMNLILRRNGEVPSFRRKEGEHE